MEVGGWDGNFYPEFFPEAIKTIYFYMKHFIYLLKSLTEKLNFAETNQELNTFIRFQFSYLSMLSIQLTLEELTLRKARAGTPGLQCWCR